MTATESSPLVAVDPIAHEGKLGRRLSRPVYRWSGFALLVGAIVLVLYGASVHAVGGNSDGATVLLEGSAMQAGNVLLHGWSLSLDSFWSIDAIFNAIAVALVGVHPYLLNVVPVFVATAVIVAGLFMLRGLPSRVGARVGVVFLVVMLGLPSPDLSYYFLQGPLHVGTVLWCLIAFLCLRRGRFSRWWFLAVVMLALSMLGDLQGLAVGVVPVFLAGLFAARRVGSWRAGSPEILAAIGSCGLAVAIRGVALAFGTFSFGSTHNSATSGDLVHNLANIPTRGLELLGVKVTPIWAMTSEPFFVVAARALCAALVVGAVLVGTWRLLRGLVARTNDRDEAWHLDDLLVLAFYADLVVFVVLSATAGNYSRYLTGAVIFGAILVARLAGQVRSVPQPRLLLGIGLVAVLCIGVGFGRDLAKPVADVPLQALSQFLVAEHLTQGIADYPSSSIITVETSQHILLRPVVEDPAGRLVRFERQSSAAWYADTTFTFVVFNAVQRWRGVDATSATLTFGPPTHSYRVGDYAVLVWARPIRVGVQGSTGSAPN